MARYFDEMRSAVEAHGGTTEKFIGDAVVDAPVHLATGDPITPAISVSRRRPNESEACTSLHPPFRLVAFYQETNGRAEMGQRQADFLSASTGTERSRRPLPARTEDAA